MYCQKMSYFFPFRPWMAAIVSCSCQIHVFCPTFVVDFLQTAHSKSRASVCPDGNARLDCGAARWSPEWRSLSAGSKQHRMLCLSQLTPHSQQELAALSHTFVSFSVDCDATFPFCCPFVAAAANVLSHKLGHVVEVHVWSGFFSKFAASS